MADMNDPQATDDGLAGMLRRRNAADEPPLGAPPAEEPPQRRGRGRAIGCLLLLLLPFLAAGHWWYWYRPRARTMSPAESRLLAATPAMPVRLWLPYPHQNLGAIETADTDPRALLAAAARLAELPPPRLPVLSPFGIPPASELIVATNADGDGGVAAARVYPTIAVLARIAGKLAGNPWLSGGDVQVDGRPARVRWEGRTWWLEQEPAGAVRESGEGGEPDSAAGWPAASAGAPGAEGRVEGPVLALVELAQADPPFPAGRYALRQEGGDLVLELQGRAREGAAALREAVDALLLLVRRRDDGDEALVLLDRDVTLLKGVPAAAAWARGRDAEDLLPGGSFLSQLTDLPGEELAGGQLLAYDNSSLDAARRLAGRFVPLASGNSDPPLSFGLWLQVRPLAERARLLQRLLDEVPLLPDEEADRWGDVALVLEAASDYERAACWLAADGSAGELRLQR
jgi:hypothetical protein